MVKRSREPKFGPWMSAILKRNNKYKRAKYSGGPRGKFIGTGFQSNVLVPRGLSSPFPAQRVANLRYCTAIELNGAAGAIAKHFFRANSLFDPDLTGGGHQPYGFDQLAAIYNHYEVQRAFITVECQPAGLGLTSGQCIIGIVPSDDGTITNDMDTIREQKDSRWTSVDSYGKGRVSHYYDKRYQFPHNFQALTADVGSSPTEVHTFCVYSTPFSAGIDPGIVYCLVTIDYTAKFWETKDLGQS